MGFAGRKEKGGHQAGKEEAPGGEGENEQEEEGAARKPAGVASRGHCRARAARGDRVHGQHVRPVRRDAKAQNRVTERVKRPQEKTR